MKNITKHIFTKLGMAVAATILLVAGANAATYTWNFQNTASLPAQSFVEVSGNCTGSCTGAPTTVSITMRAYSTGLDPNRNQSKWVNSNFTNQSSSGIGITNTVECGSCDTNSPEHAIDTYQATDIVVLDAGLGNKIDWTSFMLGWSSENSSSNNNNADVQAWTSATATNISSFNNVCFTGSCASGASNLASLGFTTNTYDNVAADSSRNIDGNPSPILAPSRYLILSGNIGQTDDAFKLKQITGNRVVPEPASIALLALGLLGLGFTRRKRTS